MDCLVSDDKLVDELRADIKSLSGTMTELRITIAELNGKIGNINKELDHKEDKGEVAKKIANDIYLHETACNTRNKQTGFWSGMTAAQKTTVVTTTVAAIGTTIAMVLQNIM